MRRVRDGNTLVTFTRQRSIHILMAVGLLYVLFFTLEIPLVTRQQQQQQQQPSTSRAHRLLHLRRPNGVVSGLLLNDDNFHSELYQSACRAGRALWEDLQSGSAPGLFAGPDNRSGPCPRSASVSGPEFLGRGSVMVIPCGLTLGSHVTVVGKPLRAARRRTCQFVMELQGLETVEGEEPPRVLHFNPRLKGDWSGKPVIELNTCYRMHWGSALRCDGWKSRAGEDTVDGLVKCEKWIGGDDDDRHAEESQVAWWLKRLIGRTKRVMVDWPFPFSENKLFVLTLSAGLEGYHINVDGRHVTSFPYRTGFTLEDATGLSLSGDIDVHSVFAASLPSVHPNISPQQHLEFLTRWRAPSLPQFGVELFIGILSAGNHFAERMAVRKSWMQHKFIKSSEVVARFFVALHPRKEVNVELKKEAEYFGDIVIVPYMDNYDLVVLKTVAICEYGEWPHEDYPPYANGPGYILSFDIADYIVSEFEAHKLRYLHAGASAVHNGEVEVVGIFFFMQLFKMEDVSVGMWVEQFNRTKPVHYLHSLKFCQFGCVENYYTAHYQSPRQMACLWHKLQKQTRPECCNMR
ncbi:hypothetical protein Fmac_026292 [Flemingia macrophylla]|uniref:Galectin domain-containing protein n=1 Tax=Flemingia macrophylla TaxID=520843 RepID=A0ABD1LEG2_9FABA